MHKGNWHLFDALINWTKIYIPYTKKALNELCSFLFSREEFWNRKSERRKVTERINWIRRVHKTSHKVGKKSKALRALEDDTVAETFQLDLSNLLLVKHDKAMWNRFVAKTFNSQFHRMYSIEKFRNNSNKWVSETK